MNLFKRSRGGRMAKPADFNAWLQYVQDQLNALEGHNFRAPITKDRFVTDTLGRVDVSSRGGENKVIEHDSEGSIRMKPVTAGTSVVVGNSANNCIKIDLEARSFEFLIDDGTKRAEITYSGWA